MFGLGGGKKEEKKDDEDGDDNKEDEEKGEDKGEEGEGGEDGDEEEVTQVAKTRKINQEQFLKEVEERSAPPPRGDTEQERDHWSRPRRWQVRLWQVRIENMTDEAILVFANFIFGGTKEEFLVRSGGKEPKIWVAGDEGIILRTPVVHDVPGDGEDTECDFDTSFEWHGSYLDLEHQTLRLEIWNWARWRVNKFDCFAEEQLLTFAKGPIQNEMECNKVDKFGKKQCRVQVSFKLFFQEIYDFELSMPVWRASALPTCSRILHRLREGIDDEEDDMLGGGGGGDRGSIGRSTRGPTMQKMQSMASEDMPQQSIKIQTPGLLRFGSRGSLLRSKKSPNDRGSILWDAWGRKAFRGYLRGTCSDLNNASLEISVQSFERLRDLGLSRRPQGATRYSMPLATAEIPLRGVLEHGEVKANLRVAPWFFGLEEGGSAHRQRCGLLQGHVSVDHRPRYQQTDDFSDELDLRKRYLFVKVIKVDRVVTPDTRPTDEIDTFVEVTFDGVAKRTRICQDDVSPSFNDDLIFELALAKTGQGKALQEDNEATWEELERKGPVFIDLWTVGSKANEHLGSVESFLQEILVDETGQPQKEVSRTARDVRLKRQETFSVRAFRGHKRLKFTWGPGQESNIFYEMWFLPDLDPLAVLKPLPFEVSLPKALAEVFEEKQDAWDGKADDLNGVTEDMDDFNKDEARSSGRQFQSMAKSIWPVESAQEHFLPRFLDVLRPPHGIDSATAVCHYVGCFPYMESKAEEAVSTPNFFCALRKGKILEHALLHCSLLLGLSFKAYVCMGTNLRDEPHAWVAVFEEDATVRFWEPFLGTGSMHLRRRFAHPQFLVPGKKSVRSLKETEMAGERRRRRRILQQTGKRPGRAVLPAAAGSTDAAPKRKTKKSMFRATAATAAAAGGHEHDMVYADLLDLGIKERPEEDRVENSSLPHCANCYAIVGGAYFYKGFKCQACEEAGSRYLVCYKCAEDVFNDLDDLEAVDLDVREKFDFEAYNSYLDSSLNDSITVLPYKTVEVVFNNVNMWMNVQNPDPRHIFWDLQNKDYWHAFAPKVAGLRPCFSACRFPMAGRDEGWCQQQRRELLQELRKVVQMNRSHKNLGTRWVTSPHLLRFLEAGLRIRAELDMEGHVIFDDEEEGKGEETTKVLELRKNLADWERTLEAKTPQEYKLSGMPMHFNYLDADEIADKVMDLCPFLLTRDKSAQFAVACHLVPLPGEVVSIYIYACELHSLGQMQLKEEREKMEAPKDDQGITVAQLLRNIGKTRTFEDEEPQDKGTALVNMMLQAAKAQKAKEAAAVEALPEVGEEVASASASQKEAAPSRGVTPRSSQSPSTMSGFARSFHSRFVRISDDGLRAAYIGTKQEDSYELHGGVMGNAPLAEAAEGKYFEVEILRTGEGHPDGLCVGVTTSRPEDLRSPPDTMDGVRSTWIAGYDGLMWDPKEADMLPIGWNPATLRAGDRVGVLVRADGAFTVYVNGEVAFERPDADVPYASPLFGVCDLLGQCDEVALDLEASVPAPAAPAEETAIVPAASHEGSVCPAAAASPEVPPETFMTGFCNKKLGYRVQLSQDGLTASYTGQTGLELHGGVIGNYPLAAQPVGGVFFAVEVVKVRGDMTDGLTLGVTTSAPHEISEMPDTIDGVPGCWTAGYDGQMFDSSSDRWTDLTWHGRDLRVGEQIGLQITAEGQMLLFQNGQLAAQAHHGVPTDVPLYALVDLLGSADGARLLPDAPAPRASASGPGAATAAAAPALESQPTMTAWCRERLGRMVSLSEDALSASYASSSYAHFGGLTGNGPLKSHEDCWYFEVCVDAVREGAQDGLAIGVTTCSPRMLPEDLPQTMDEIDPCWLLGFDGMEWDGAQLLWGPALWCPQTLKVEDHLGVIVTMAGELQVSVNGSIVAQATFALPTERPLYAVVDLIGATRGVRLLPDARPPVLDPNAPPRTFVPPDMSEDPFAASEAGDCVAVEDVEFDDEEEAEAPAPQREMFESVQAAPMSSAVKVSVIPPEEVAEAAPSEVSPAKVSVEVAPTGPKPVEAAAQQAPAETRSSDPLEAVLAAEARATQPAADRPVAATASSSSSPVAAAAPAPREEGRKLSPGDGADVTSSTAPRTEGSKPGSLDRSGHPSQQPAAAVVAVVPTSTAGDAACPASREGSTATTAALKSEKKESSKLNVPSTGPSSASPPRYRPGPKRKPVKGARTRENGPGKSSSSDGAPPAAMRVAASQGFHEKKKGKYVTVAPGGLRARHRAPDMEMWGGCLGAQPLKQESYGFYFEIRIDAVTTGMPDGLAIGVATDVPDALREVPEILDGLEQSWLIGFDGVMYDGVDFIDVDWHPSDLRIGDRVGLLVTPAGQLKVYVNGKWRVDGPSNVDVSRNLYAAVDLIGNTDGVEYLPEARCPALRASAVPRPERGFHRGSLGRALRLSADGWSVEHQSGESLHGTALGAASAELVADVGRYFEVHIDEVLPDQPDGMALGFTSHRPDEVVEPPATSDALRDAWLAGFDGAVWDGSKAEWLLSNWDTRNLAAGDAVGALVDLQGTLRIFVNGRQVVRGPKLPTAFAAAEATLFPVVDLLGAVRRLSLLPKATSPSLTSEEAAAENGSAEGYMTGFHPDKVGTAILLSEEGHAAGRRGGQAHLQGGVVLGNAPLEAAKDGSVGFSLTVAHAAEVGETEGMAVGMTTRPPNELTTVPATADEVDPSYLLGFDGAGWDGSAMKWHYSEWQPTELKEGDVIDVVLDAFRRLHVFVNGEPKALQTMQVSNHKGPFYALLDIYSAGLGVALRAASAPAPG